MHIFLQIIMIPHFLIDFCQAFIIDILGDWVLLSKLASDYEFIVILIV